MPPSRTPQRTRSAVSQLAAQLLASESAADFRSAKRKAAERLGVDPDRFMPTNLEVQQALIEYQRLFQSDTRPALLAALRKAALDAMTFLHEFNPCLVGSVLSGTATANTEVLLHVFCDTPEQVGIFLQNHGIPFAEGARTVKLTVTRNAELPAYRFLAGETPVVLIAFHERLRNATPLSQIDGKPVRRATRTEVAALLAGAP